MLAMVGHEMMHALDPRGIQSLEGYEPDDKDDVMREYTKRALCLRKSHKSVLSLSGQEGTLSDELDSENLADLVGVKLTYDAFNSLESGYRDQYLAGLDMSAQKLFFFNNCAKWCSQEESDAPRYAPKRSRCIVPLMNMPEFSRAFGCAAGTPMNPTQKCTFW
ncbi:neprilysin-1-like [Rhipicephalus sanguineus]|uniref:neprilysin-1-like n=1 Tax=Rhipicephalus sanguineus TaxID=34632 RepID=UPI001895C77B|nr:neprilysin-1-like [Rhipicephalus sanguineus]